MELDELFRAGVQIGFEAVEMWGREDNFKDILALAAKYGLKVASMVGAPFLQQSLNSRAQHDLIEKELKTSIDIAAENGIRGVIALSGDRYDGVSDEQAVEIVADVLKRVAPYAEEKDVFVNLELLNSKRDHIGYQCDHTAWGVKVVERVDSPRVKLLYDIYHMQIMEGDVITTITENIQWIGHFHTAGNPGRHEINDSQEINYTGICKAIAATDYDGYLGHEFFCEGNVVEALKDAFTRCDQA